MITPYICVSDSRAAIAYLEAALGAEVVEGPYVGDDGSIGHVTLRIGDAELMMSDEYLSAGVQPPLEGRGAPVTMHLRVDDCDATVASCLAAGARLDREPGNAGVGRIAVLTDPFGHRWMINGPEI